MRKRGISHVEIIFSFVLFMAAVGFALYFFRPVDTNRLVDSSLAYTFREVTKNASTEIEVFSVVVNNATIPSGTDTIGVEVLGLDPMWKARAVTEDGEILGTSRSNDIFYIESVSGWSSVEFVTLTVGEEFTDNGLSGVLNRSYYDISSSENKEVISEAKFLLLNQSYYADYSAVRSNFNLPNRVNFGFALELPDGPKIVAEQQIPEGLEVFSDEKRIEILKTDGEVAFGKLSVKVW